jgi:lactoylglutathione lyase
LRVGFVVLYVNDAEACQQFWIDKVGMVEKGRQQAGELSVVEVGFADQSFSFQLVPLALMANNPDNLDLATPSIAFKVDDLALTRENLVSAGIPATEVGNHTGVESFAFPDNEGRWFAVLAG